MARAKGDRFRLDTFVNRVTFDRMVEALQLFLQPSGVGDSGRGTTGFTVSRTIRDLMLYRCALSCLGITYVM